MGVSIFKTSKTKSDVEAGAEGVLQVASKQAKLRVDGHSQKVIDGFKTSKTKSIATLPRVKR